MTRDDIIRMAREAGFQIGESRDGPDDVWGTGENLERFAALVAAAEREACAAIAREIGTNTEAEDFALDKCYEIENAIRARGEK